MIAVRYQPEIEIKYSDDEVFICITKINDYGNVKNESLSFPICHLEAVIHTLTDVKDSL